MKSEKYLLKKEGYVPYYITEEEFQKCVKIIEENKKEKLQKVLTEMYDCFGEERTINLVGEMLNNFSIRG